MNLYLIGYRCTGKTTVARLLAELLQWPWCDADVLLEECAGKNISQIFTAEGEEGFRRRETEILRELSQKVDWVVATGGGVVLGEENRKLLGQGRVVWLSASPEVIWQRLQKDQTTTDRRPNLSRGGLEEVRELLGARTPLYEACAEAQIDTEKRAPKEVASLVLDFVQSKKK